MAMYRSTSSTSLSLDAVVMMCLLRLRARSSLTGLDAVLAQAERRGGYLRGHGARVSSWVMSGDANDDHTAARHRRPPARMAATPAHDADGSRAGSRDIDAASELRRDGQGAALARDGAASLRPP